MRPGRERRKRLLKKYILVAVKGLVIGGTMLVPGVSGGSMAMILGIYDKLIASVSSFMKQKRKNFFFLLCFGIGAVSGMVLFAKPLLKLIDSFPMPTMYFFIGAVAGGIPMICRHAKITSFTWKIPVYTLLGAAIVLALSMIPVSSSETQTEAGFFSFLLLIVSGFVAAVALILPGISVSYVLLLIGLYDETMKAISTFYLPFLIPLAIGLAAGVILTTKLLEKAMARYPRPTYLMILGFILGSVITIFPGIPNLYELIFCILSFAAGFAAIYILSRKEYAD